MVVSVNHPRRFSLTRKDLAERYNISVSTVDRWVSSGVLPKPKRMGAKVVRFLMADLESFEASMGVNQHAD